MSSLFDTGIIPIINDHIKQLSEEQCAIEGCSKGSFARQHCRKHYDDLPRIRQQHRMQDRPEYNAWADMKARCSNPKRRDHKWYKNIEVCDEWQNDFMAFYNHIGERPGKGYSLDRIDNNGNYEPGNVRWADWKTQQNNRRKRTEWKRGSDGKFIR